MKMITKNLLLSFAAPMFLTSPVWASGISCKDSSIQDSQITATFRNGNGEVTVSLRIPTGETSTENANGTCTSEEDVSDLSLRCSNIISNSGRKYFARIDGRKATVAENGRIIAVIPCAGHL